MIKSILKVLIISLTFCDLGFEFMTLPYGTNATLNCYVVVLSMYDLASDCAMKP
jgi:type III secretory pathway component EscU